MVAYAIGIGIVASNGDSLIRTQRILPLLVGDLRYTDGLFLVHALAHGYMLWADMGVGALEREHPQEPIIVVAFCEGDGHGGAVEGGGFVEGNG